MTRWGSRRLVLFFGCGLWFEPRSGRISSLQRDSAAAREYGAACLVSNFDVMQSRSWDCGWRGGAAAARKCT